MTQNYKLVDVTPVEMQCIGGIGCHAIYEVERVTPEDMQCVVGACNEIYRTQKGDYLLIGTIVKPEDAGLEGKVGKNEALIKVPKKLIDERQR